MGPCGPGEEPGGAPLPGDPFLPSGWDSGGGCPNHSFTEAPGRLRPRSWAAQILKHRPRGPLRWQVASSQQQNQKNFYQIKKLFKRTFLSR